MKVNYKTVVKGQDHFRYEKGVIDHAAGPCCAAMHEAFDDYIKFGGSYDDTPKLHIQEKGWEGDVSYHPIDFCPFCGQRIECVEVLRTRIVRTPKVVTSTTYEEKEEVVGAAPPPKEDEAP